LVLLALVGVFKRILDLRDPVFEQIIFESLDLANHRASLFTQFLETRKVSEETLSCFEVLLNFHGELSGPNDG
jgi:hypothetical protein